MLFKTKSGRHFVERGLEIYPDDLRAPYVTCMVLSNSFSWKIICQLHAIIHIFRFASILEYRVCCIPNINPPGADTGIFRAKKVHSMGVDIQGFYSLSGNRSYREISKRRDWMLQWSYRSEIWHAAQQNCCRGACQISELLEKFKGPRDEGNNLKLSSIGKDFNLTWEEWLYITGGPAMGLLPDT